jgi:hypothetical protein
MFYACHFSTEWMASWEEVQEVERPSHHQPKRMLTVFFSGIGEFCMNSLPKSQKINSTYYAQKILHPLSAVCCPDRAEMAKRQMTVHFDNASIHNATEVRECVDKCGLSRVERRPYSQDLAPCDYFFLVYLKGKLVVRTFSESHDLFQAVDEISWDILRDTFHRVCEDWIGRLGGYRKRRGEYAE